MVSKKIKKRVAKTERKESVFGKPIGDQLRVNCDTTKNLMSEELIPAEELDDALKRCPEWEAEGDTIIRTIEFEEYMEGIDFVNDLAEIVDEAQHFPEIDIRDCTVTLRLKTEDAGGVTEIDVELASRIDNLVD